jgi:hypothetical protein
LYRSKEKNIKNTRYENVKNSRWDKVTGKHGNGVIASIITKSTGYVLVNWENGCVSKEMAFNLTGEDGEALKSKPASQHLSKHQKDALEIARYNAQPNGEKLMQSLMWVNGISGDRNSSSYKIWEEMLYEIQIKANEVGNTFVPQVIETVTRMMRVSERQAIVIANFADKNGIQAK